jgi:endonuclease YncB( thermonuclease family)
LDFMIRSLVDSRGVLVAGALVLVAGCSTSPPPTATTHNIGPPTRAVVSNVLAPDTVNVTIGTHSFLVRVLGIRTPRPGAYRDSCGWPGALGYAQQVLANEQVTLVGDPNQPDGDPDGQGRSPRYLRLSDGSDYSTTVAAAGWARAELDTQRPLQEDTQLRAAQTAARDAGRALWAQCPAVTAQEGAP